MTKYLLVIFLLSGNAIADWTKVNSDSVATDYIDVESVRKTDYGVSMWIRSDFKEPALLPSGKSYSSILNLTEYDCSNRRYRNLATNTYNGKVPVTLDNNVGEWKYTTPDSYGAEIAKRACSIL